ncbi:MAG: hypothetical protein M3313_08730 [Actinomycetota bacterium]|nr:hypothetical protein [Actinomycetota bacterium]
MPVDAGSLHYAVGPVAAVVVVVILTLFIRWAFAPARSGSKTTPFAHGLLRPVATTGTRESALALSAVLSDAGIRSTISARDSSHVDVLVFADDVPRARPLALGFGQISDA